MIDLPPASFGLRQNLSPQSTGHVLGYAAYSTHLIVIGQFFGAGENLCVAFMDTIFVNQMSLMLIRAQGRTGNSAAERTLTAGA
ncbi:MAG: hypothetical protein AMJ92_07335 [candidate division Zixibacteria bacterium SM23_81]|nr:MAG: hypothetical protein AMJ92_07335 [candidate division Zixibacteria bacterium SM23_81]